MDGAYSWFFALPFLASMLFLGLPHGAIDHILYFRGTGRAITPRRLLVFIGAYLLFAGCMLALWYLMPLACLIAFILLTAYHWGEGDAIYEAQRSGFRSRAFWLLRGIIPMAMPLIFYASTYISVLQSALPNGVEMPASLTALVASPLLKAAMLGTVVILIAVTSRQAAAQLNSSYARRLILESTMLTVALLALPPLFAIGFYFMAWHAWRHIQVSAKIIGEPMQRANGNLSLTGFYRLAWPFTLAALVGIALLLAAESRPLYQWQDWIGKYLAALWALTWPHAVICHLISQRQAQPLRALRSHISYAS
ncbi:MAG: Brp/Blh family beta-carotene 15,15'-dioxygenase [Verrucomicrobiota bacterium]